MGRHKIIRPPDVTFHITQGRTWLGNGFGTEPAHWEARLNEAVIATWHPNGGGESRTVRAEIFGVHEYFIYKHAEWKTRVRMEVDRRAECGYRMKGDVTEIWESRPAHKGNPMSPAGACWEHWHYVEPSGSHRTGHMMGTIPRTGDFEINYAASMKLQDEHKLTCPFYTEYREW